METSGSCPLPSGKVIESYFLEHRAKLIDIAAFLDRVERAADAPNSGDRDDFRIVAFRKAVAVLLDGDGERARRVLDTFSDHTQELPQDAAGSKGALGAVPEVTP